jgi:peptidoglycan/xylan/chitin deacetylase (PgdA/CDA1 family)
VTGSKSARRILAALARGAARKLLRRGAVRPADVAFDGGVVSFTFDDFPKTAWTKGGKALAKFGAKGTYYVSAGLAGQTGEMGAMFEAADAREAHHAGHEIACHTFSHLNCARAAKGEILAQLRDNAAALSAMLDGFAPRNFAFPYGAVSAAAMRAVGPRFASCRGIADGINHASSDLAQLSANKIYASIFDETRLRALIDRNRSLGGWLIFYTHDVDEAPSRYGCTPEQLERVVGYAAERSEILPVRDAVARLPAG